MQKRKLKFEEIKQIGSNSGFGIWAHICLVQNSAFLMRVRLPCTLWKIERSQTNKTQDWLKVQLTRTVDFRDCHVLSASSIPLLTCSYPKPWESIFSHPHPKTLCKKCLDLIYNLGHLRVLALDALDQALVNLLEA